MAFQKIDREFCLTDDSVNVYGYRLLTGGLQLDTFNPPIGFLMHKRELGVAVRWEDFRTEVGKLYAKPVVNTTLFPDLAQQIEDGFYSAASVGHIVAVEVSDDPALRLEGQTGPTVTKWFPRECSIVDIPGNYNALAKLYDESDGVLQDLSDNINSGDNTPTNENNMDKPMILVAEMNLPNLSADATPEQAHVVLQDLVAKAARVDAAEKELADLKAEQVTKEVDAILAQGLSDKKLTQALADKMKVQFASNPEGLKDLVDSMQAQTVVTHQLNADDIPAHLAGKTWQDLYTSGQLEEVKKSYPDLYAKLKDESHAK